VTPASAPQANLNAMTGGASAVKPAAAGPSADRLAAVRAIAKPQTDDPGDDEYSYGYRLWEAKFYPEAQQQLKLFVTKYPRHSRVSYGRNLLGRAYLDAGKPVEAAQWFLQNYNADRSGGRAPDSLLYLAIAMKQVQDTNRSCIVLGEFSRTYAAEAAGRLKSQYDATRNGLKCS
jgi:TolA-binding protein